MRFTVYQFVATKTKKSTKKQQTQTTNNKENNAETTDLTGVAKRNNESQYIKTINNQQL